MGARAHFVATGRRTGRRDSRGPGSIRLVAAGVGVGPRRADRGAAITGSVTDAGTSAPLLGFPSISTTHGRIVAWANTNGSGPTHSGPRRAPTICVRQQPWLRGPAVPGYRLPPASRLPGHHGTPITLASGESRVIGLCVAAPHHHSTVTAETGGRAGRRPGISVYANGSYLRAVAQTRSASTSWRTDAGRLLRPHANSTDYVDELYDGSPAAAEKGFLPPSPVERPHARRGDAENRHRLRTEGDRSASRGR